MNGGNVYNDVILDLHPDKYFVRRPWRIPRMRDGCGFLQEGGVAEDAADAEVCAESSGNQAGLEDWM